MRYNPLGNTGLVVPRLCFGTGTTTFDSESAQSKQRIEEFGHALLHAHAHGLSFWDTSDNYGTHAHVAWALAQLPRASVTITTKTYAETAAGARASLENSLRELGTDYVDLLLLHEPDSPEELESRWDALLELRRAKREGLVRAVGLSTHAILTLERVAGLAEVDVILTNFNFANEHMDADIADYRAAMQQAAAAGQGVIAMKTLGEGKLADRREEAIAYNLAQPFIHSVVVGMMNVAQVHDCLAIARRYWESEVHA